MAASQYPTPDNVLRTLERAIESRRSFTSWYESQSLKDPSLIASNETHKHFNSILDELLEVMTLHSVEASLEQRVDVKSTFESESAWQTSLDDLELEPFSQGASSEVPSSDGRMTAPDEGLTSEPQSNETLPPDIYGVENPAEDLQFAVFNVIKDLHLLRQHVHGLLDRYNVDGISLLTLSAIINTAIGTVRRTEKDLLESWPEYSSWEKVMETVVPSEQIEAVFGNSSNYDDKTPQKDFLDSIYCLPFQELRRFRDSLAEGWFPRHWGGELVSTSRVKASQTEIDDWIPGTIILYEFFREVVLLRFTATLPTEDELTRGLIEVFNQGPIHLWVVFGLQIFLDTQRILGNSQIPGIDQMY